MKIENFIVFCLIVFFTFINEQIKTLRITNINSTGNFLEKNNINFSSKSEPNNLINNLKQNPNLNSQFMSDKSQPPTFSQSFFEKANLVANGGDNYQHKYYAELLKQIEEKKKVLENLSKRANIANSPNTAQTIQQQYPMQILNPNSNNNFMQNQGLNQANQKNTLITSKIENNLANTNFKPHTMLKQDGKLTNPMAFSFNNETFNKNPLNNFSMMQSGPNENSANIENPLMLFKEASMLKFDEVKNLLIQTQMKIISENSGFFEKMKENISNEIKPILKTIADMQFFTYKKIKNIENSLSRMKDFHPGNKTINDLSDLRIPNYDEDLGEVGKLIKLSTMPEVDDLSSFGIEDAKSSGNGNNKGKNNKGKGNEENFGNNNSSSNNKVKYNRNIRKSSKGGKEVELDNTNSEGIKKMVKNDKYSDP